MQLYFHVQNFLLLKDLNKTYHCCGIIETNAGSEDVFYDGFSIEKIPSRIKILDIRNVLKKKNDSFWYGCLFADNNLQYYCVAKYTFKRDNYNRIGYRCFYFISHKNKNELSVEQIYNIIENLSTKNKNIKFNDLSKNDPHIWVLIDNTIKNKVVNKNHFYSKNENILASLENTYVSPKGNCPNKKTTNTVFISIIIMFAIFLISFWTIPMLSDITIPNYKKPKITHIDTTKNISINITINEIESYLKSGIYNKKNHSIAEKKIKNCQKLTCEILKKRLKELTLFNEILLKSDSISRKCKNHKPCNKKLLKEYLLFIETSNYIRSDLDSIINSIQVALKKIPKPNECLDKKNFFCMYDTKAKTWQSYSTKEWKKKEVFIKNGATLINDITREYLIKRDSFSKQKYRIIAYNKKLVNGDFLVCNKDSCSVIILVDNQ